MSRSTDAYHGGNNGNGSPKNKHNFDAPFDVADFLKGFAELQTAYECASLQDTPWLFAVEIYLLREMGLSNTILRWMILNDFLDHRIEVTESGQQGRIFELTGFLKFDSHSCVMLTEAGNNWLCQMFQENSITHVDLSVPRPSEDPKPFWDDQRKRLMVGTDIIKHFRVYSPNQETVLTAFQEEDWPVRIDDPLQPVEEICSKTRLHDTIKNLNKNQKKNLLKFRGDGTGEGVLWEFC